MQKVITLFKRDYKRTRLVYDEIVEGAEWVVAGEGVATEKIDGTSCMVWHGKLYKRYDAKKGKQPPSNFEPAQDPDPITGHWPGWVPVGDGPEDKWHRQAWETLWDIRPCRLFDWGIVPGLHSSTPEGVTYELIGPKVQGNKYGLVTHIFRAHGDVILEEAPRDFETLKQYFEEHPQYEGIVWWHPDGRMVKIKRKDFGLPW